MEVFVRLRRKDDGDDGDGDDNDDNDNRDDERLYKANLDVVTSLKCCS